jgi:UV DNA damage repair endonuclease
MLSHIQMIDEEKNDEDAVTLILKAMWESEELIKVTQNIKKRLEILMALENDKKLLLQACVFDQL